jgi:TPR repeat protein
MPVGEGFFRFLKSEDVLSEQFATHSTVAQQDGIKPTPLPTGSTPSPNPENVPERQLPTGNDHLILIYGGDRHSSMYQQTAGEGMGMTNKCTYCALAVVFAVVLAAGMVLGTAGVVLADAESGDATAQYNLGVAYEQGEVVPLDYVEAAKWYRKAAEQGHADAQNNLGAYYFVGRGIPQDYVEAVKWYRKAAEQGHAVAQYNLGLSYHLGKGTPQDYAEAAKWYRNAAEQGHAPAQHNLGVMYLLGQHLPQDYAVSAMWFKKAAEQGHAMAQYNLGVAYYNGNGVQEDYLLAYFWMTLSETGSTGVDCIIIEESRDEIVNMLTSEQLQEAQQMILAWAANHPRR